MTEIYHERTSTWRVRAVCIDRHTNSCNDGSSGNRLYPVKATFRRIASELFALDSNVSSDVYCVNRIGFTSQRSSCQKRNFYVCCAWYLLRFSLGLCGVPDSFRIRPNGWTLHRDVFNYHYFLYWAAGVGEFPDLAKQLKPQVMIIIIQGLVAVAYPVFSAVLIRLSGAQQTILSFRYEANYCENSDKSSRIRRSHRIFSVDVFNVYYIAICMQATTSTLTTLIIIFILPICIPCTCGTIPSPVAAFYPHTAAMSESKLKATVASILIFSVIEFVAFVGLLVPFKRRFGFSPLHQLAFAFEMQFCAVQGHLIPVLTYHTAKEPLSRSNTLSHSLVKIYSDISVFWRRIQIGHREHYSVERVLAFRDYCERTSPFRVFAVCILTPVPAATVMLLIECIPLKDPELGWKANWMMFFSNHRGREDLNPSSYWYHNCFGYSVHWAWLSAGCSVDVSHPVWNSLNGLSFCLHYHESHRIQYRSERTQVEPETAKATDWAHYRVVNPIAASCGVPDVQRVFLQLSGLQQAVFMLLLPLIKFITKQYRQSRNTPARLHWTVIIFSVDVFNVLYVAICMKRRVRCLPLCW
ncbi:hypothetical protein GQ600_25541 [Phytophthora cactorum]|nr:hypothetical protein GQ600_25541 [Phytophthora cactorum]